MIKPLPLVSVVIPTHNNCDYKRGIALSSAMHSVADQSYQNLEIIVVDDCSTDDTEDFVKRTARFVDCPVLYYKTAKQSGSPVVPRNLGVEASNGKYLAFLDADDIMYKDKIRIQVEHMEFYNGSCGDACIMCYHDMDVKEGKLIRRWSDLSSCYGGPSEFLFGKLIKKNFIPCSSVMINLEKYPKPYMNPDFKISHDWDLFLSMSQIGDIHFINIRLGQLTLHEGSVVTDTHQRRKESRQVIRNRKYCIEKWEYRKIMVRYYLVEIYDRLPKKMQGIIRKLI